MPDRIRRRGGTLWPQAEKLKDVKGSLTGAGAPWTGVSSSTSALSSRTKNGLRVPIAGRDLPIAGRSEVRSGVPSRQGEAGDPQRGCRDCMSRRERRPSSNPTSTPLCQTPFISLCEGWENEKPLCRRKVWDRERSPNADPRWCNKPADWSTGSAQRRGAPFSASAR